MEQNDHDAFVEAAERIDPKDVMISGEKLPLCEEEPTDEG